MELQYFGGNCTRIATKKAHIIIDDNLGDMGLKQVARAGDIVLFTGPHGEAAKDAKIIIDQPGEYEVSDISIQGIAARSHIDEEGSKTATIYKVVTDDVRIGILGHIYPELSDQQLEALGTIDVLLVPVGGNGLTLDPVGALHVIKEIEPKIVIPTHYEDKDIKYPVPQQPLEEVLKGLSMEPRETVPKIKLKAGEMGDVTQLVVLERQ